MSNKSQLHQPLQLSCLLRRATQMISRLRGAALMVLMMSKRMVHSQLRIKRSLKAQTSQTRSLKRAKIRLQQPMAKNRLTRHQLSNMKVAVLTMNGRIRTKKHLLQINNSNKSNKFSNSSRLKRRNSNNSLQLKLIRQLSQQLQLLLNSNSYVNNSKPQHLPPSNRNKNFSRHLAILLVNGLFNGEKHCYSVISRAASSTRTTRPCSTGTRRLSTMQAWPTRLSISMRMPSLPTSRSSH